MNLCGHKPLTFEECPKHELKMSSLLICFHFLYFIQKFSVYVLNVYVTLLLFPFFLNFAGPSCMGMWSYEAFQALAVRKLFSCFI